MQPLQLPLVCLYEDRHQQVSGLKLLLLSLNRYCPQWAVRLRFPGISNAFRTWLGQFAQVHLIDESLQMSGSYNVKPTVLLDGLSTGTKTCLWLDTDVLVNGPLDFIASDSAESILLTQDPWEYPDGSTHRCNSWGLNSARSLPGPFNSAVVRVSQIHKPFLKAWERVLASDMYLKEQAKPVESRNQHMLGDQDALSALLASQKFASIPLRKLLHPTEILQHHGPAAYGLAQRWSNIAQGMPPLLHAMGSVKPWRMPKHPNLLRNPGEYYERSYLELSPYLHYARSYREALKESANWLDFHTLVARFGSIISLNRPWLKGATQAAVHRAWWRVSGIRARPRLIGKRR